MADTQVFTKQLLQILPTVFQKRAAFAPAFGQLQAIDGVRDNATAFSVKTNDMPVVIGSYSTDPNVAFGTGTANSSRFGDRKEVIYTDTEVPYSAPWAFDEGLDRYTVNADLQSAVAARLVAQSQALIARNNVSLGKALTEAGTDLGVDSSDVVALFNAASKKKINSEIVAPMRAYVTADVYNAIMDSGLTTTSKSSSANVDENTITKFKGFVIEEVNDAYTNGKTVIFAPDEIGRTFVGISTTRTIEVDEFDGVALQGAGKDGIYIPEANKAAIFTASASK